jgi:dTMP kinase
LSNLFIAIEGIDGCGKTTVTKKLAERLKGICFKTPSGFLANFRKYFENAPALIRFAYFITATIISSFEIRKLLKNDHVICDRYIYSTWIYHIVYGLRFLQNIPLDKILPISKPHITFLLIVNEEERKKRISERKTTRKDRDSETLALVQEKYCSFDNLVKINTVNFSADQVVNEILTYL